MKPIDSCQIMLVVRSNLVIIAYLLIIFSPSLESLKRVTDDDEVEWSSCTKGEIKNCKTNFDKLDLTCKLKNDSAEYSIADNKISVEIRETASLKRLKIGYPCGYDYNGQCLKSNELGKPSSSNYHCFFRMKNFVIAGDGRIINCETKSVVSFSDQSISGRNDGQEDVRKTWVRHFVNDAKKFCTKSINTAAEMQHYDIVVPTRMLWDDCFNHISFQSLPVIAHLFELENGLWNNVIWHTSLFTAALLRLLDVPSEKIVIAKDIVAKQIVLPWLPYWYPIRSATYGGITSRISKIITTNLLALPIKESDRLPSSEKLIVFFWRSIYRPRSVVNHAELVQILRDYVKPGYRVIELRLIPEHDTIEKLHASWRVQAEVISKARVIIGPHGGAFNTLIWAPDDCDFIEFNLYPNYKPALRAIPTDFGNQRKIREAPPRPVFLAAAWAKGIQGKFWILESIKLHPSDFYLGKILISPREMLEIFQQLQLLRNDVINPTTFPIASNHNEIWIPKEAMSLYIYYQTKYNRTIEKDPNLLQNQSTVAANRLKRIKSRLSLLNSKKSNFRNSNNDAKGTTLSKVSQNLEEYKKVAMSQAIAASNNNNNKYTNQSRLDIQLNSIPITQRKDHKWLDNILEPLAIG